MQGSEVGVTMNVCVIPARGGSKRIPRKNIKEFNYFVFHYILFTEFLSIKFDLSIFQMVLLNKLMILLAL